MMTTSLKSVLVLALLVTVAACRLKEEAPPGEPAPIPAPADVAAPPADALRTPSGLASKILRVGLGNFKPTPTSFVSVHYTGWTTDGKMFDSSLGQRPIEFVIVQNGRPSVIPGWVEALQLMRMGEKRRFWIPGHLAYDNIPDTPGMPPSPKGMLVFDMELLQVR